MINSLKSWHDYFSKNRSRNGNLLWDMSDELTADEKGCIENSIAAFQLGEYSEGKGLLKSASAYAARIDNQYLVPITKLFIVEEQNHALLLKQFMDIYNIKPIKKNWTDAVFRRLRKNVGFELTITVLITAEIISVVYYRALKRATNSTLLAGICDKILADEAFHIKYESEIINHIRDSKPVAVRHLTALMHLLLFSGTLLVVYGAHKRVIKRGEYNFSDFRAECRSEFATCFSQTMVVQTSESH